MIINYGFGSNNYTPVSIIERIQYKDTTIVVVWCNNVAIVG